MTRYLLALAAWLLLAVMAALAWALGVTRLRLRPRGWWR